MLHGVTLTLTLTISLGISDMLPINQFSRLLAKLRTSWVSELGTALKTSGTKTPTNF